ncbi:MAG: hypothetical protein V5B36_12880 [Candidatus Accumulibacter sp. UW25]
MRQKAAAHAIDLSDLVAVSDPVAFITVHRNRSRHRATSATSPSSSLPQSKRFERLQVAGPTSTAEESRSSRPARRLCAGRPPRRAADALGRHPAGLSWSPPGISRERVVLRLFISDQRRSR